MSIPEAPPVSGPATPHRLRWWLLLSGITLVVLLTQRQWEGLWLGTAGIPSPFSLGPATVLAVFIPALLCEYLDTSLGMGFGTLMAPLLLFIGFEPLDIVPALLISELLTGLAAGLLHQRHGNIDLIHDRRARRTLVLLAGLSGVGAVAAVLLGVQINHPWFAYASVALILTLGVMTLATVRRPFRFRGKGLLAVGMIAAFSKGVSGGGYGLLVTTGQMICGVPARQAVAITSIAEALTCLVVLMGFLAVKGIPDLWLATPLTAGALLAVPWATLTVRRISAGWLRAGVGALALTLGLVSLSKVLG